MSEPADRDRRGHKVELPVGDPLTIGEELRCERGAVGPRGIEFFSVTGVNDGVIMLRTLAPVRGNKWFPPPVASEPEDDDVKFHTSSSIMYLFALTGVCGTEAIAESMETTSIPTRSTMRVRTCTFHTLVEPKHRASADNLYIG